MTDTHCKRGRASLRAAAFLGASLGGALVLGPPAALAVEYGQYAAPGLEGYLLARESESDQNGDGIIDTHTRVYRNAEGDSIFSITTHNKLWAWSLSTHGEQSPDPEQNYVIRDSDCDGTFDERYALDDEFVTPLCLK